MEPKEEQDFGKLWEKLFNETMKARNLAPDSFEYKLYKLLFDQIPDDLPAGTPDAESIANTILSTLCNAVVEMTFAFSYGNDVVSAIQLQHISSKFRILAKDTADRVLKGRKLDPDGHLPTGQSGSC